MKKNQSQSFLTYGSIVSISHVQDDDAFIMADGFVKRNLMIRNFGTIDRVDPSLKKVKNWPFYNTLFQIYPKLSNVAKGEIQKEVLNENDEEEGNVAPDEILDGMLASQIDIEEEDITALSKEDINMHQTKLMNEFKYNLDTFEKTKNLKVSYKQTIQFLHLASSKFLACYQKEARFEQSNYKMTLDDMPSDASLFKIMPAYKYQKEGEQVIYASDIVYLVRAQQFMNKETYVHASGEMGDFGKTAHKRKQVQEVQQVEIDRSIGFIQNLEVLLKKQPTVGKLPLVSLNTNQQMVEESGFKKRELNASVEDKTQWKLSVYSEYIPETQGGLKCGDVIWLHHSETNTTIAAARKDNVMSFEMNKWLSVETLSLKIIEGKSKESYEEYIGDTYSMWVIEYENYRQGGLVMYEQNYRFKHLSSGLYLAGKSGLVNKKNSFYLSIRRTEETLFRFMPLKNQILSDKVVKKGSYTYICNSKDFWIDIIPMIDDIGVQKMNTQSGIVSMTTKLEENNEEKYIPILHQEAHKCDQSVFKLYASTTNDVWEIQFILSCVKILLNYLGDLKNMRLSNENADKEAMKDYLNKITTTKLCLKDLDDFCNNKLYNSTPEQKFDSVNPFRQKLLREQYYIDILMRILDNSFSAEEILLWEQRFSWRQSDMEAVGQTGSQKLISTLGVAQKTNQFKNKMIKQKQVGAKGSGLSQGEMMGFVAHKVDVCMTVFQLISSICKDNRDNEMYTFNLSAHILAHVRHIPQAINCLISLIKNNMELLNKLSENLTVEFDITNFENQDPDEEKSHHRRQSRNNSQLQNQGNESDISLNKHKHHSHHDLQNHNLLIHFMQLVEMDDCPHRSDFLKFLRSVCRFEDQGINCNQENIFKLYKKLNDKRKKMGVVVQNSSQFGEIEEHRLVYREGRLILPSKCSDRKEMNFIVEQLLFYGDVSYGRNYLWKKELQGQLEKGFIFQNIWNPLDRQYEELQPSFCKIAMSLYVDYEPLNRINVPEYCRLFRDTDVKIKTPPFAPDDPDVNNYQKLIDDLIKYLINIKDQVQAAVGDKMREIDFQAQKLEKKTEDQIRKEKDKAKENLVNQEELEYQQLEQSNLAKPKDLNILSKEILFNSMDMLSLALELDLFEVLQTEQRKSDDYYKQIVEIVIYLLAFDKKNLPFVAALQETQKKEVEKRRKIKRDKKELINMNPLEMLKKLRGMMVEMTNVLVTKEPEDDEDDDDDDEQNFDSQIDDVQMYTNPLMRGFIFLKNKLEAANKEDNNMSPIEVELKLKICDILDHFLDMRQDFLISNVLTFYKHFVVLAEQTQLKEEIQLEEQMRNHGKGDDEITSAKNVMMCERIVKFHALGLLPNIAKTGIMLVDEPKKETNDPFGGFSLKKMSDALNFAEKKPEAFRNYFTASKLVTQETFDLDGYFSLANNDDDLSEGPIACMLPYLLSSIYFMNDPNLERRCLKVITRIFNQREELIQNISRLQIIFDPQKTQLYELLHSVNGKLQQMSDRSEIWFTDFTRRVNSASSEFEETINIIKNLRWAFFYLIKIQGNEIILQGAENIQEIDSEKQSIVNSIGLHVPVINIIKDQLQNLIEFIQDEKSPVDRRIEAVSLFQCSFQFLRNFCKKCHANQLVLYNFLPNFVNHLEFSLGQVALICEIFQDNYQLLTTQVNQQFLQIFVRMIELFGRQERFLEPFLTVIRYRDKYLFDNQLQILNLFLSSKTHSYNHHILYARPDVKDLEFSFDGKLSLIEDDVMADVQAEQGPKHDNPYHYHRKLLELLLASTLLTAEKAIYNPNFEDIHQRDNFTISVAKLKKTFKASYLMNLLRQPDSLTGNEQTGKGTSVIKHMLRGGKDSKELRGSQIFTPRTEEKAESSKKGLSILKKQICQFYRLVHITSEKYHSHNPQMIGDVTHLLELETVRFDKMIPNENLTRYIDYLIEGLLPLFISYYERIIMPRKQNQGNDEEDESEDQKDVDGMTHFADKLSKGIDTILWKALTKKRQVQILKKFFDYFPKTLIHEMMVRHEQDAHPDQDTKSRKGQKNQPELSVNPEMKARILYLMGGSDLDPQFNNSPPVDHNDIMNSEQQPLLSDPRNGVNHSQAGRTIFNMGNADNNSNSSQGKTGKMGLLSFIGGSKKAKKAANFDQMEIEGMMSEEKAKDVENLWNDFKEVLLNSKIVEEEIEKETEMLANAIMYVDQYIAPEKQKVIDSKLDLRMIVKQFINFLQYAVNNPKNKTTIITLLKVLRKVIEKELDEKKAEMQDQFNKLGATRMVLIVLSESSRSVDKETYRHFLMFLNSLLDGGNHLVQKTIFEFLTSYQKSEVIFQRFNHVIKQQIETISAKAKEKKQQLQRKNQAGLEEEIDEQTETLQERLQAQEDEKVMNQVLKFLQNCVEGHYLELQNYIRQQTSSRNSYNMINQVADLLKAYYYEDRSQQMYDNMIRCLDTLNELVQGPCLENQIAVSESKFFEIASDLFSQKKDKEAKTGSVSQSNVNVSKMRSTKSMFASSKSNVMRKNAAQADDLEEWMVARLQMKCLILILSLIEMRELSESNPIIKRIMRNLPVNLLQRHLVKCYKKYQNIYSEYVMEVFDHVKIDPRDLDPKVRETYHEAYFQTIIQNGFYIYFLMCYYYMCDPKMDNQFVQFYKTFRRKQLKQTKGALEDLLFGDNIVGQLVSFAMSLLEQGIYIAKQLQLAAYEAMRSKNQMTPEQVEKMEQEKQQQKKRILRMSCEFFMKNSASIEVVRNDELETVYFIKLPYVHLLPKEQKIEFSDWVDRGSTKSKVQGLVDQSDSFIEICIHEERLKRFFNKQKFLALFANYVKLWKDLAFMFTILLNLFIIGSFSDAKGDRLQDYSLFQQDEYSTDRTKEIFRICGIIMSCCSIFVVLFFLCKNAPLIIQKAWSEKTPFDSQDQNFVMWFVVVFVKLLTVLIFILKEIEVIYYLAYGALAVLGTVWHPFFFSFHLTEILIRYPTLKNVIRSVYQPREQLLLTLVLFIIFVYVYGLIGYTFFSDDYQENRCSSALFCFLFTFDWTFKANAGVGGYLTGNEDGSDDPPVEKYKIGRFIFDNSSNIFLVIIMVNIVAGIIIDTFGSLREEEGDKIRDIEDKCFICGNLKTTFDRLSDNTSGGGFAHHIRINHYMWNYLFFIAYLKYKDPNEYTGIEQFVWQKIERKDLNWFPFNKATELKGLEEDEEEEVGRVSRIQTDMSAVVEEMQKANKALSNIKQRKQIQGQTQIKP